MTFLIEDRRREDRGPLRENQIVFLLRWGLTNKEVARIIGISEGTIKVHTKTIYRKLGVTNRIQTAIAACKHWGFPDESIRAPTNESELNALLFDGNR